MLAACAMVSSSPMLIDGEGVCESSAGAYYLPKTLLYVQVDEKSGAGEGGEKNISHEISLSYKRVPDRRFGFCLDYLARATSDDTVDIKKYSDTHLLGIVSTDAVDQTRYILQTLIQSVFTVASGNPAFPGARSFGSRALPSRTVLKAEFDPFNAPRAAEINDALREYGFCMVLEPHTVDLRATSVEAYCDNPRRVLQRAGAVNLDYDYSRPVFLDEGRRRGKGGIFYRPRVPYQLHVYLNKQYKGARWQLGLTRAIEMENISPVLAARVDRTIFAQRKTTLIFDEGMLENVCVFKKSELLEAANIPLQVVQSVVALPTEVIQIRINQTNNQASLVRAETELIKTQREYIEFLRNPEATKPSADGRPGTFTNTPASKVLAKTAADTSANETFNDICPTDKELNQTGYASVFPPESVQ